MLEEKQLETLIQRRRAFQAWKIFGSILLLMIVGGGVWWYWHNSKSKSDEANLSKNIGHVRRGSVDVRISSTGTIRPFNQVKLSPKFTGLVKALYVQQGDYVRKGQVIALMDESNIVGQLDAARGAYLSAKATYEKEVHGNRPQELEDAEAQMSKAQSMVRAATMAINHTKADLKAGQAQLTRDEINARRLTELHHEGAVSDQDRLNAETQAEVSRAQLQRTQQDLKQTEAMLSQSRADLHSAEEKLSMSKEGFRKEDIRAVQESMLQAKGNMDYIGSQLADCRIRAPFDGIVTQKYADIGAIVAPTTSSTNNSATSSSIVSIAGRLEMVAAVSEADIDNIHPGQPVAISASAYSGRAFHGRVTLIAPEAIVNQNVTSFEVHSSIDDDKQHKLMSGMNVNTDFIAGRRENVLLIPTMCVVTKKGKTGVFVPDRQNRPQFKPITLGTTSDTEAIVTGGVKDGEPIFIALTKEQLIEQGYTERSILAPPGSNNSNSDNKSELKNKQ